MLSPIFSSNNISWFTPQTEPQEGSHLKVRGWLVSLRYKGSVAGWGPHHPPLSPDNQSAHWEFSRHQQSRMSGVLLKETRCIIFVSMEMIAMGKSRTWLAPLHHVRVKCVSTVSDTRWGRALEGGSPRLSSDPVTEQLSLMWAFNLKVK